MVDRTQYWIYGIFILAVAIIASPIFAGPGSADAPREGAWLMAAKSASVYDFTLKDIDGKPVSLDQFKGKVLLIVNTASFCGNTPNFKTCMKPMRRRDWRFSRSLPTILGNRNLGRTRKSRVFASPNTV